MKWSELVDRSILQFGTNPHNKAIARKFLEEAEKDLAYYSKCYSKDQSIIINNKKNSVDLPKDFLEFKSAIQFNNQILEGFRNQIGRLDSSGNAVEGTPRYYFIQNNELILVPSPSVDGVVNFTYLAEPKSASSSTYHKMNYKQLDNGFFQKGTQIKGKDSQATGVVYNDENDLKQGVLTLSNIVSGSLVLSSVFPITTNLTSITLVGTGSKSGLVPASGQIILTWGSSSTDTISYSGYSVSGNNFNFNDVNGINGTIPSGATATYTSSFKQNEEIRTIDDAYNLAIADETIASINTNWDEYGLSARAVASSSVFEWTDADRYEPQIPTPYHIYLVDYAKSCVAENIKEFELADRFMRRYYENRELVRQQVSGQGSGSGQMVVADIVFRNEL